jgi:hypothetical protein
MAHRVHHTRQCATDGCTRFLKSRWPHRTCPACRGEEDLPPPPRPGTRQARVTYATSHSGTAATAEITLPAEPWHTKAATA